MPLFRKKAKSTAFAATANAKGSSNSNQSNEVLDFWQLEQPHQTQLLQTADQSEGPKDILFTPTTHPFGQETQRIIRQLSDINITTQLKDIHFTDPYSKNEDITDSTATESSFSEASLSIRESNKPHRVLYPSRIYKVKVNPIDCSMGIVMENQHIPKLPLQSIILQERRVENADVTVVFAIRRPGCGACREHGRQLAELAAMFPPGTIHCLGIIKQINVDNIALLDFYDNYFTYPLYKDEHWGIYKAMGNRKISPMKLLALLPKMTARYKKKNIVNIPFGGDIFTQGGILVFDRNGMLKYAMYETYGEELDLDQLKEAVQQARTPSDLPNMTPH